MSYDGLSVQFEDRLLAHLHILILQKFRSKQSFVMSWVDGLGAGSGRTVIWLTPDLPIVFKFAGSRLPAIDRNWLAVLSESAESSNGLIVTNERGELAKSTGISLHTN
jgi:hypothetical protein